MWEVRNRQQTRWILQAAATISLQKEGAAVTAARGGSWCSAQTEMSLKPPFMVLVPCLSLAVDCQVLHVHAWFCTSRYEAEWDNFSCYLGHILPAFPALGAVATSHSSAVSSCSSFFASLVLCRVWNRVTLLGLPSAILLFAHSTGAHCPQVRPLPPPSPGHGSPLPPQPLATAASVPPQRYLSHGLLWRPWSVRQISMGFSNVVWHGSPLLGLKGCD